jgi:16S rRNA (cytosine967-C5)-methyltransferase
MRMNREKGSGDGRRRPDEHRPPAPRQRSGPRPDGSRRDRDAPAGGARGAGGAGGGTRPRRPPRLSGEALAAVTAAVEAVMSERRRADAALKHELTSRRRLPAEERDQAAAAVHDILRRWRSLAYRAGVRRREVDAADVAAVVETWQQGDRSDRSDRDSRGRAGGARKPSPDFAVEHSLPDWLDRLGTEEMGPERWRAFAATAELAPPVYVRVNTLKITMPALAQRLRSECGSAPRGVGWSPDAMAFETERNLVATPSHHEGLFELQDAASQMVARALDAQPGMRVVDGCAGAGGKTLHLAALMRNQGTILALDPDERKLARLRARARRAGVTIVEARVVDSTKVIKRRHGTADRLLLDVPCSGLGVIRRNPDIKWRLAPADLGRVREVQYRILSGYAPLVRPGGRLVYATCSILRSEGEAQVRRFVESSPGWSIAEERRWGPPEQDCDAFYIAVLARRE